jgi:hypothetical protein
MITRLRKSRTGFSVTSRGFLLSRLTVINPGIYFRSDFFKSAASFSQSLFRFPGSGENKFGFTKLFSRISKAIGLNFFLHFRAEI